MEEDILCLMSTTSEAEGGLNKNRSLCSTAAHAARKDGLIEDAWMRLGYVPSICESVVTSPGDSSKTTNVLCS